MAEPSIRGPLRKPNLADQTRLHPVHVLAREAAPRKQGPVLLEGGELSAQRGEELVVEPGSDLPRVDQVAPLVVADQQRTEALPAALGIGVTANHELLLVDA